MKSRLNNNPKFSQAKGISLIEILVTIVITSIGLMGLVSLQMQAVRATTDSGNRSQAIWVKGDMKNRIQANQIASASYVSAGPVSCLAAPATVCSSYHDGTNLINAANCTSAQLATWDRYEVACRLRPAPFIGDSITYLPDAQITIACTGAACNNGDELTVTLQWRARTDDQEITGGARDASSGLLTRSESFFP